MEEHFEYFIGGIGIDDTESMRDFLSYLKGEGYKATAKTGLGNWAIYTDKLLDDAIKTRLTRRGIEFQ